jgi:acyl-CoA thioester hydrolase
MADPFVSPSFTLRFVAPEADVDELGHVSNVAYVRWIQEVAKAHSAAVGLDFAEYRRLGGVFVVRRHEVDYLLSVLGGDAVVLTTHIADMRGASSERRTVITRESDGREVARAVTSWAFIAIEGARPRRIPSEILAAFAKPV